MKQFYNCSQSRHSKRHAGHVGGVVDGHSIVLSGAKPHIETKEVFHRWTPERRLIFKAVRTDEGLLHKRKQSRWKMYVKKK